MFCGESSQIAYSSATTWREAAPAGGVLVLSRRPEPYPRGHRGASCDVRGGGRRSRGGSMWTRAYIDRRTSGKCPRTGVAHRRSLVHAPRPHLSTSDLDDRRAAFWARSQTHPRQRVPLPGPRREKRRPGTQPSRGDRARREGRPTLVAASASPTGSACRCRRSSRLLRTCRARHPRGHVPRCAVGEPESHGEPEPSARATLRERILPGRYRCPRSV